MIRFFFLCRSLTNLTKEVSGVLVCRNIGVTCLRTKHKLSLLHFSLQLSSVDCACVWRKLLVNLARVWLINLSLARTTKLEVALSQICCRSYRCIHRYRFILRQTTALVGALESLSTLGTSCYSCMRDLNVTRRNRNPFYNLDLRWFALISRCQILISAKLEMSLA